MSWIELKSNVNQLLKERDLTNPNIRFNALDKLERLIKTNFPKIYNNPTTLIQIDKNAFKVMLSQYKKLNSAESSVINNFYDVLSNSKCLGNRKKSDSSEISKINLRGKLKIVDSENEIKSPVYGLEPVINGATEVLILGTFPANESIKAKFYYQNQIKRFWGQALSSISSFEELSNEGRKTLLLQKSIGLWDIFECVEREGSNSDNYIVKAKFNKLEDLFVKYPSIKYIIFNGKNSFQWLSDYKPDMLNREKFEIKVLQSSSGANSHFNNGEDWKKYFQTLFN
jgi:hypoxanthine-DNA glycosylase